MVDLPPVNIWLRDLSPKTDAEADAEALATAVARWRARASSSLQSLEAADASKIMEVVEGQIRLMLKFERDSFMIDGRATEEDFEIALDVPFATIVFKLRNEARTKDSAFQARGNS
jgi:phosphosulfolactate phosphohydrolase-like enzyme